MKEKLRLTGRRISKELNQTVNETKKTVKILRTLEAALGDFLEEKIEITESHSKIYKDSKKIQADLIEECGLEWERKIVTADESVLVAYFNLEKFLPWLLNLPGWNELFVFPKNQLVIAVDPDGFPTYRWPKPIGGSWC